MYKFVVLAAVAAAASAGIAPVGLTGYAGYAAAPLNLGYAAAPVAAAYAAGPIDLGTTVRELPRTPVVHPEPARIALPQVQTNYALPAPRTIPGETLKSEVVEPVEIWGYDVAY